MAKKKAKDPFREIQNCLQKRDYKGALGWFRALLEKEKRNTQIRLRYADTLVLAGSKKEAVRQYRIVADELAEAGFMIRAIAINKKIVQLDPSQSDVHEKLAAMNEERSKSARPPATTPSAVPSPPSPEPPAPPKPEVEPPRSEPLPEPTMSLEDSLAMEFGETSQPASPAPKPEELQEEPSPDQVEELEVSLEGEDESGGAEPVEQVLPPEEGVLLPEPSEQEGGEPEGEDVQIFLDGGDELGGRQPEEEPAAFEIVEQSGGDEPEFQFESSDAPELTAPGTPGTEGEPVGLSDDVAGAGEESDDDVPVEFEVETEPDEAADGATPLVGLLGEDIDSLIDSIIDDVGSSASAPPAPAQPKEQTPGGIPLFSQLTMQEFLDVALVLQRRSVKAGTVIVRQGEPGDSLFIVSTGAVDATREDDGNRVPVARFLDGDFFGEMAVLTGEPRTATVTAAKNTELLELSREDLHQIFSKHPEVEAKIRLAYDERAMNGPG